MIVFIFFFLGGVLILALSNLTKNNYLSDAKKEWIYEPIFFRSFAISLMFFGLSGALLCAFKVNPVFTVILAAIIGLIIFLAVFFLINIFRGIKKE